MTNKHVGDECPRCTDATLEDDGSGHAVCNKEEEYTGRCGFSTEGMDD